MRVLLVTSWNTPHGCGIEAHSRYLIDAVKAADPEIRIEPSAAGLDPIQADLTGADIVHLNYHAALHSRWNAAEIMAVQAYQKRVLVTFHDTGVPNSDQCKSVIDACDAAVVHEPFTDLPTEKTHYWRQGVLDLDPDMHPWRPVKTPTRPYLGTVGHDFPWKNTDLICELAAEAGWGVVYCTPTPLPRERLEQLAAKNPWLAVYDGLSAENVIATLHWCSATAFLYTCANTGTSGAIRLGIAARKPVLAFRSCRQFRDLADDPDNPLGRRAIEWCDTVEDVKHRLRSITLGEWSAGINALAELDSWRGLGQKYSALYRSLVA